jgi:hypothetical protein
MDQRILTTTLAALALVAGYGAASAQPSGLFHTAAAVIAPDAGQIMNPREVITPPSDVDRDMAITPPHSGARMPIITPPETPAGRFGIQR